MLYRLFSSNRPIVFTLLIPVALALAILAGLYSEPPTHLMGGLLFHKLSGLFGGSRIFLLATGTLVNLSSAFLINKLANDHDFMVRENYFVGLVYYISVSLELSWIYLNPVSLSLLFVLLALRRILRVYRVQNVTSNLYDTGLFLALSVFIFPPIAPVLFLAWLGLAQLRTFNLREWLVPFFGIATPLIYALVYYWWFDYSPDIFRFLKLSRFSLGELADADHLVDYLFIGLGFIMALIGLTRYFSEMSVSTVHKKNTKAVFLWLCLLLVVSYVLTSALLVDQAGTSMLWALPTAVFIPVFLNLQQRRLLVLLSFYLWLLLGVSVLVLNTL